MLVMHNQRHLYISYGLGNSKCLVSSVPRIEVKTKHIILIINHNITVCQKYKDEENKGGKENVLGELDGERNYCILELNISLSDINKCIREEK